MAQDLSLTRFAGVIWRRDGGTEALFYSFYTSAPAEKCLACGCISTVRTANETQPERTKMPSQNEIRQQITQQIIEAIERGTMPWRMPWQRAANTGRPVSLASGKAYSGINPLLLALHAEKHGLRSRWWATFQGWQKIGGQVKARPADVEPGHWGARAVLYRPFTKTVRDDETNEEKDEQHFLLRFFTLFNADQVEGVDPLQSKDPEPLAKQPEPDYEPAEELIRVSGADIRHGGDRAFYRRPTPEGSWPHHTAGDFIGLPNKTVFTTVGAYYETALHELAHWSELRTGWDYSKQGYPLSELAAEIGSCYLSQELGVPQGEGLENHASYVKSWLDAMKGDPSFIFKASKQASKVSDFLLAFVRQPQAEPVVAEAA